MAKYFLGIDQGTTLTTALLMDEKCNVISKGCKEHKQIFPKSGWVEHDPIDIFDSCLEAISFAMKGCAGFKASDLIALGIDHQGETCLLWEKETGRPIYNAIVWQDRRTANFAEQLKSEYRDYIHQTTGLVSDAYYSATKIRWILDNVEGAREKAEKGELLAGTLNTWLIWKLTDGNSFATDACTGGRYMLMDLKTTQWDIKLMELMDIPINILPPICNCNQIFGYTDPDVFFGAKIPVAGSLTDSNAGLVGGGCFKKGMLKNSYGTGSFMSLLTGMDYIISQNGLTSTCCWKLDGVPYYTLNGAAYIAGAAVQWLRDGLKIINKPEETEAMALSVKDTSDVYFVPAFAGLATPYWDQYARGIIVGLTGGVSREHLVRAVLESIAFQTADCFISMKADYKEAITTMRADGGIVDNSFLMQFQADLLGIPVEIPFEKESAALGSACIAALTTGTFSNLREIESHIKLKKIFEPNMGEEERQERLYQWHRAVERSKSWIEPKNI